MRILKLLPRVTAQSERDLFAWSLLAAIGLLCLLAAPFFTGELYTADDLGSFHLPARAYYAQQLARGEAFDWMPSIFSGYYLTGDGEAGTYHPLHHLLYRYLPLRAALGWEFLLSYPLMLAGTYWLLRRRLGRRDAAMFGSVAFTFSGFNLLHFVHPGAVATVAHIPWLLLMIDIVLVDARRWKVALAQAFLALLTGSQLLLGCPQFVGYSLLVETCFALLLLITRRYSPRDGCESMPTCRVCIGCRRSSIGCVVIAKAIGLLVGAVQMLPTLDALLHSGPGSVDAAPSAPLHPINLVQLVAPYLSLDRAFGGSARDLGLYVGAAPLMLVLWVFVRCKELEGMGRLAAATGLFALFALLMALGSQSHAGSDGTFHWTSFFAFSCRYIVLFQFAMAVLAAIGFALVEREGRQKNKIQRILRTTRQPQSAAAAFWRQYELLGATVLVSAAIAVAGLIAHGRFRVASPAQVLVGPLLMAAAALLVIAAAQGVRGALVALILFMAADLGYYGLGCSLGDAAARPDDFLARSVAPPGKPHGNAADPQRVFAPPEESGAAPLGNEMTLEGWQRTDGCATLRPRKALDYYQLAALRADATRWVHRSPSTAAIVGLSRYDDDWSQVPDPLPAARLVTQVVASDKPAADLPRIDLAREALCEYSFALPPGSPGTAAIMRRGGGRIDVKVSCPTPQMLVLAESYHPGWRCMVDGTPATAYRVNGDFLGCLVEPGNCEVRWAFEPESLRRGRLVTLAGLGLVGLCLLTGVSRRELALVEKIGLRRPTW